MNSPSFVMSLKEVATAVNGQLKGEDRIVHGVSTDSRSTEKQNLFVALSGPNFDGHNFVTTAIEQGAVAVIVAKVRP